MIRENIYHDLKNIQGGFVICGRRHLDIKKNYETLSKEK